MKRINKLVLARETLLPLQDQTLAGVVGGGVTGQPPQGDLTNSRNCGPCGSQYFCIPRTTTLGNSVAK